MRIAFDDGGYLELQRSRKPAHVHVLIAARRPDNHLELLVNSAEVPLKQLIEAIESISGPIIQKGKQNEDIEDNNQGSPEEKQDHQ